MQTFHTLQIKHIIQETANAVSLVFELPESIAPAFAFQPGQYLTLQTTLNGETIRRAYSICSTPSSGELKVAIKAVENGSFSVYATSSLKVGDTLEVAPPEGKFILEPESNLNHIAFAAGSGITPIIAMIKTVLEESDKSTFTLVYSNKKVNDIIFKSELEQLQQTYPERFNLSYVFTQERVEEALFGRIDEGYTNYFIKNKYKDIAFNAAYLCGPEAMINTVSETLRNNGFSEAHIHFELFTVSVDEEKLSEVKEGITEVTLVLDDEESVFNMSQTDTILAASLREQLDPPYSCQGGVCSSCLAKITDGKAIMTKNTILTDAEVADGFILTCQAHPTTPKITVDFDDV